jgi:hypothetical protein
MLSDRSDNFSDNRRHDRHKFEGKRLAERLHMALSPTPTSPPITPASDNHPSFQENAPFVRYPLAFIGIENRHKRQN